MPDSIVIPTNQRRAPNNEGKQPDPSHQSFCSARRHKARIADGPCDCHVAVKTDAAEVED